MLYPSELQGLLEHEIRTMLDISPQEREQIYGTKGWKILILRYIEVVNSQQKEK